MATPPKPHDQPDGPQHDEEPGTGNPTQLPVEPEFGPALPAAEPEDPGVPAPKI